MSFSSNEDRGGGGGGGGRRGGGRWWGRSEGGEVLSPLGWVPEWRVVWGEYNSTSSKHSRSNSLTRGIMVGGYGPGSSKHSLTHWPQGGGGGGVGGGLGLLIERLSSKQSLILWPQRDRWGLLINTSHWEFQALRNSLTSLRDGMGWDGMRWDLLIRRVAGSSKRSVTHWPQNDGS